MRLFVDGLGDMVPAFDRESFQAHQYSNGTECIVLRAPDRQIEVVKAILNSYEGPIKFLYVLLKTLSEEFQMGRYLSPELDREKAIDLLDRFGSFLVDDARQEFWFLTPTPFKVVCDVHDRIWLYGDTRTFRNILEGLRIPEAPIDPIPAPHIHKYVNGDQNQSMQILSLWEWDYSPIQDRDGE